MKSGKHCVVWAHHESDLPLETLAPLVLPCLEAEFGSPHETLVTLPKAHTLQIELQQSIFLLEELDDVANLDVWHDLAEVLHILTDMSLVFEADRPAAQAAKATPA